MNFFGFNKTKKENTAMSESTNERKTLSQLRSMKIADMTGEEYERFQNANMSHKKINALAAVGASTIGFAQMFAGLTMEAGKAVLNTGKGLIREKRLERITEISKERTKLVELKSAGKISVSEYDSKLDELEEEEYSLL